MEVHCWKRRMVGHFFWERLIQTVKRTLKKVTGWSCLSFEEHNTLLVEVEGIVNARPLTYVYDDLCGINFALTPSNFINGCRLLNTPNSSLLRLLVPMNHWPEDLGIRNAYSTSLQKQGERITWSAYVRLTQRVQGEPETLKFLLVTWHCLTMIQPRKCFRK